MGLLVHAAKGEGYTGYDPTPTRSAAKTPCGALLGSDDDDRRPNISATWRYDVPTLTNKPVSSS